MNLKIISAIYTRINSQKMKRRPCNCPKKKYKKKGFPLFQTYDCIEWLKSRVPKTNFTNRTVKFKYTIHPAEIKEQNAVKKVFDNFDEDKNSNTYINLRTIGSERSNGKI